MPFRHSLLRALPFVFVATALAKPPADQKSKGLPPKFGGLIQPAPPSPAGGPAGLITSDLAGKDLEFFMQTLELGRLQSWLVKTAQEKGTSPEMRAIGGALMEVQGQENDFVSKLAASKGLAAPDPSVPAGAQKKVAAQMAPLSGVKLDKELLDEIVNTAESSVNTYQGALQSTDPDVKRLCEQMIPAAKSRLQFAGKAAGRTFDPPVKFRASVPTPAPAAPAAPATPAPVVKPPAPVKTAPLASPAPAAKPAAPMAKPAAAVPTPTAPAATPFALRANPVPAPGATPAPTAPPKPPAPTPVSERQFLTATPPPLTK